MPGEDPMAEGNGGYIKVYRKLLDNDVFKDPHALHVWIYLLLEANWKDVMRLDGKVVKRGSLRFAVQAEAPRFGLSYKQLRLIIDKFAACSMVVTEGASRYTLISICQYDTYQSFENGEGRTEGEQRANRGRAEGDSSKKGIREEGKKKGRGGRSRFQRPTPEDVSIYAQSIGYELDGNKFVDYYESVGWTIGKGKPMKSWKGAVRTWKIRDTPKDPASRIATKEDMDKWTP